MPPLALGLTLLAALIHASWNVLVAHSRDPQLATAMTALVSVTLPLPLVALDWRASSAVLPFVVGSGALELGYLVLLAAAYGRAELSFVYPVARGTAPVLVLIVGAVALGVPHSGAQVAGVGLVAVGVILVGGLGGPARGRDLLAALAVGACIAGYTTVDKAGVVHASPLAYYELVTGWPAIAYGLGMAKVRGPAAVQGALTPATVLAGLGMFAAYSLVLGALGIAAAASVAAVRETGVVLATAMGALFLHEPVGPRRLTGAALVAIGVAALALG
jgi:drug/metabolite transporter (DMT)-like permease